MTGRNKEELNGVTLLGSQKNKYPVGLRARGAGDLRRTSIRATTISSKFNCPEFTSLCPITGQPDFATIYISYVPDVRMVESKSLKLYLFSFRNHGDFHEDCVNIIMKDLIALMDPKYIEVWGKFTPRGGISIDPYCNYGKPRHPLGGSGLGRACPITTCTPRRWTTDERKGYGPVQRRRGQHNLSCACHREARQGECVRAVHLLRSEAR